MEGETFHAQQAKCNNLSPRTTGREVMDNWCEYASQDGEIRNVLQVIGWLAVQLQGDQNVVNVCSVVSYMCMSSIHSSSSSTAVVVETQAQTWCGKSPMMFYRVAVYWSDAAACSAQQAQYRKRLPMREVKDNWREYVSGTPVLCCSCVCCSRFMNTGARCRTAVQQKCSNANTEVVIYHI